MFANAWGVQQVRLLISNFPHVPIRKIDNIGQWRVKGGSGSKSVSDPRQTLLTDFGWPTENISSSSGKEGEWMFEPNIGNSQNTKLTDPFHASPCFACKGEWIFWLFDRPIGRKILEMDN